VVLAVLALTAACSGPNLVPPDTSNDTDADPTGSDAVTTTTTSAVSPEEATAGIVIVPSGGVELSEAAGGPSFVRIHDGITLGFQHRDGEWLEVMTTCNDDAWVRQSDVEVVPQAKRATPGPGFDLSAAVIVVDPGHGDRDWGGVGPTGLGEKEVNLDIAVRVRALMEEPHTVDWATGAISSGNDIPAFGAVWLTRDPAGPNGGDYEAGLGYRAELANAAGADVMVSIHNNTVPNTHTDIPGTEVYYAMSVPGADRLAGILYEELLVSFAAFDVDWSGGDIQGARAREDPDTGGDYYGIFRRAQMPAAIVEGAYISEPEEEALLRTDAFRQAYAEGVYRGVVRFLTTDDPGSSIHEPELFTADAGTVSGSGCVVPSQ
jgi:N-acetylmuramoyl-L-alanine amidase